MTTTFTTTNTNKRVAHIWLSSQLGEPFTQEINESPATSQIYQFNLPEVEMPKYTKYTLKVNKFQMGPNHPYDIGTSVYGLAPLNPPVPLKVNIDGGFDITSFGCFIEMIGNPFELNYVPNVNAVGLGVGPEPSSRGADAAGRAICGFDATAVGNGLSAQSTYENPKIVVNGSILGHNAVRIKIIDQAYFETVIGDISRPTAVPPRGISPLPPWTMCLEIEGIDGFEEFDMNAPQAKPNPTNGINTMNHSGFVDNNNYNSGGNGQIGY